MCIFHCNGLSKTNNSVLRGNIAAGTGEGSYAGYGAEIDNSPALIVLEQMLKLFSAAIEYGIYVDIHYSQPLLGGILINSVRIAGYAGVVDEKLYVAEFVFSGLDKANHIIFIGQITFDKYGIAAVKLYLFDNGLPALLVSSGYDNICSLGSGT